VTASGSSKVLLFGKDARTDAIAEGIGRSAGDFELAICSPLQIPGLVDKADRFFVAAMTDLGAMVSVAQTVAPDLVIVGPEDPLAVGLVDALSELGMPCFGPPKDLARIETSKGWARSLLSKYGIAGNISHRAFASLDGLDDYVRQLGDVVVKPDGLTGGKGVKVMGEQLSSVEDAISYARSLLEADGSVVIEERLDGEEFSLQTITDGFAAAHCPPVQDHKRAYTGDTGPNTGGMGSYSCADHSLPFLSEADLNQATEINEAVIAAVREETGKSYRGVLYGGFMAVADGVRVIEYNARFGDPEATNVLPLLSSDLLEVCRSVAAGELGGMTVEFARRATVCKYVVPSGYPEGKADDDSIAVDPSVTGVAGLHCYWAATDLGGDGRVRLTGSRALALVGIGDSLAEAEQLAEKGAASVSGSVRHRADIGTAELVERRVEHMSSLRATRD
jgi:phosphoribosylamine--glycine ligase